MVEAWYMNESTEDPKLEHHLDPPEYVPIEDLSFLSRVEVYKANVKDLATDVAFMKLIKDNGYNYNDRIEISRRFLMNYDEKLKVFYSEHLHDDDEIRLFLDGSGYFDVRDLCDRWIRIKAETGDLIILPAGIYHRFTPDIEEYALVMRFFCGNPVWTAIDRPTDGNEDEINERESRKNHLNILGRNSLMMLNEEMDGGEEIDLNEQL